MNMQEKMAELATYDKDKHIFVHTKEEYGTAYEVLDVQDFADVLDYDIEFLGDYDVRLAPRSAKSFFKCWGCEHIHDKPMVYKDVDWGNIKISPQRICFEYRCGIEVEILGDISYTFEPHYLTEGLPLEEVNPPEAILNTYHPDTYRLDTWIDKVQELLDEMKEERNSR